jgi:hypothetical protein
VFPIPFRWLECRYSRDMSTPPTLAMKWFARSLVVLTCTAGALVLAGPSLGAAPSRHAAQPPICVSYEGEHVCIQGWSTGVTATYSGSSTDAQGNVFQDGNLLLGKSVGGNPLSLLNVHVNWRGTGTLFLPLPEGTWLVAATIYGNHANRPAGPAYGRLVVGPSELPPPTTCSTVAQGVASVVIGQAQPWVSGISATMNGDCSGYWITSPAGVVNGVGGAALLGGYNSLDQGISAGGATPPINGTVVGIARTPDSKGYWLAASDGGIFAFGDAAFYGSMGGTHLNQPIVGITATSDGRGYWLAASDGGIFAFGDAAFYGSMGDTHFNQPIVGITATSDGRGYWLVASDGGVFAFGDAAFRGSLGGVPLNKPIVAVAGDPDGSGYWLVAADGGVFAFGAPFLGSLGGTTLSAPVVGLSPSPVGAGYYLLGADSAVYAFRNARYLGAPTRQGCPFLCSQ